MATIKMKKPTIIAITMPMTAHAYGFDATALPRAAAPFFPADFAAFFPADFAKSVAPALLFLLLCIRGVLDID